MTKICPDCGQDHSGLPALWPVGTEVQAITWIKFKFRGELDIISINQGTTGRVIEHTSDGRPVVKFHGHIGVHSFHYPATALERVSSDGEYWPEPPVAVKWESEGSDGTA